MDEPNNREATNQNKQQNNKKRGMRTLQAHPMLHGRPKIEHINNRRRTTNDHNNNTKHARHKQSTVKILTISSISLLVVLISSASITTTRATTRAHSNQPEPSERPNRARDHVQRLAARSAARRTVFADNQTDDVESKPSELSPRLAAHGALFELLPAHSKALSLLGRIYSGSCRCE